MKYGPHILYTLVFLDPSFWGLSERPQKYTNDPKSAIFEVVRKVNMSHSQVCLFFGFLQYLVSTFHDIAHENSWFMTRKNGFGS